MESAIASTVTASSVMLAAYGFSYNALKDRIDAASDVGLKATDPEAVKKQRKTVVKGALTAGALAALAFVIWLVLLKPAVNEVEAGIRVHFAFSHYSTLDIIFVLLTIAWLAIAVGLAIKAISLIKDIKNYPAP
jgi:hypothetical protein